MKTQSAFLAFFLILPAPICVAAGETMSSNSTVPADAIYVSDFQRLHAAVHALANSPKGGTVILKRGRYIGTQPLVLNRTTGKAQGASNRRINLWAEAGQEVDPPVAG